MRNVSVRDLLPIGSVVMLKGAQKRLMIFGICQTEEESKQEYDYIGVLYPEGNMGEEIRFMFNHSDVEEVIFTGFVDEERNAFIDRLDEFYAKN